MVRRGTPPAAEDSATAAQVKADIDNGLTGDKATGLDPAAAPLGADEEAGGAVYDPALLAQERRSQHRSGVTSQGRNAVTSELAPNGWRRDETVLAATALLGVALIVAALVASAV